MGSVAEKAPDTSFTIGIDTAEVVRQKVEETAPYNVIKVKMGVEGDRELVEVIRSATDKPLCVNANRDGPIRSGRSKRSAGSPSAIRCSSSSRCPRR